MFDGGEIISKEVVKLGIGLSLILRSAPIKKSPRAFFASLGLFILLYYFLAKHLTNAL